MKTIQEIRADLRDIRYYFSRKESFEKLSGLNIRCEIEEKIKTLQEKGFGAKDISIILSELYGMNKNKIYKIAVGKQM